jgi:hypothetical protein
MRLAVYAQLAYLRTRFVLIYERERINLVFLLNYRIFNLLITPSIMYIYSIFPVMMFP